VISLSLLHLPPLPRTQADIGFSSLIELEKSKPQVKTGQLGSAVYKRDGYNFFHYNINRNWHICEIIQAVNFQRDLHTNVLFEVPPYLKCYTSLV